MKASVERVVEFDNRLKQERVDDEMDEKNPEQALDLLVHRTLGQSKNVNQDRADSYESHVVEHRGVNDGLGEIRDSKRKHRPEHTKGDVDKKQLVPDSNRVEADDQTPGFLSVIFLRQAPLQRHFWIDREEVPTDHEVGKWYSNRYVEDIDPTKLPRPKAKLDQPWIVATKDCGRNSDREPEKGPEPQITYIVGPRLDRGDTQPRYGPQEHGHASPKGGVLDSPDQR